MEKRNHMWLPQKQPIIFEIITWTFKIFGKGFNKSLFSFVSNMPGKVAIVFRSSIARNITKIGKFVIFEKGVIIRGWENLEIGDYCTFNEYCYINAEGGVKIGDYVMIAYFAKIISDSHLYKKDQPIIKQEIIRKPITIEDDVWVGTGATITLGKTLKKGSIISANSLVNKNTEEYGIYGGVPAKLIQMRH